MLNQQSGALANPWYWIQSGPGEAAENMAFDEAWLEFCALDGRPGLRFYGWQQPAATFGISQHYATISRATPLRPLVRRPTGGGLVAHTADWTYSLVLPPPHPWYALPAIESYRRIHEWLQAAWAQLGIATELAPMARKEIPGQCFFGAEKYDLLWLGRKIAGAAQRRTRSGLLTQGSVQSQPPGIQRADWEKAMLEVGTLKFGAQWTPFRPAAGFQERVIQLAREKYAQPAYNERR